MSQLVHHISSTHAVSSPRRSMSSIAWVAMGAALVGTLFVLALSIDWSDGNGGRAASQGNSQAASQSIPSRANPTGVRFDGGPNEGTRGIAAQPANVRFDGGPNEGTRGALVNSTVVQPPAIAVKSFDRGPRAGNGGSEPPFSLSSNLAVNRFDGGPNEGTRGAVVQYTPSSTVG